MFVMGKQWDVAKFSVGGLVALAPLFANAQTVVIGANDPAVDLPAVQAAVNGGGSVQLRGIFDFGIAGRVIVKNDVDIGGEIDVRGEPTTVVRNGEWPFHTPYPSFNTLPLPAGPKVAIHDLRFLGARGTAIHLAYSGGTEVRHNVIQQMRARQTGATSERAAIVVGPAILGNLPGKTIPNSTFVDGLVSGDIMVADNRIDVSVDRLASPAETTTTMRSTGMFVSMYKGADVRIERNLVTGNTRTGLAILDGDFDADGRGSLFIAGNTVSSDVTIGFTQAGPRAPLGMVTGFNNQRPIGADPHRAMIPVLITDNVIELNGATSMGIVNIWNGAVLTANRITVHTDINKVVDRLSTSGGVLATGSNQILMHNRIEGEGCNAIRYGGTTDGQERFGNLSKANNVSHFSAFEGGFDKCATYWLEPASHDNVVVGDSGSAIDEGTDNKVTGLRAVSGGVGQAISAANHFAAERTDELATFGFE